MELHKAIKPGDASHAQNFAHILAGSADLRTARTRYINHWRNFPGSAIQREIDAIRIEWERQLHVEGDVEGDNTGPAWRLAALLSLLDHGG